MKEDEIKFFITCINYATAIVRGEVIERIAPRDIIDMVSQWLPPKRAYYYLQKWSDLGFYDYGVSLGCGWLETDKIPERYRKLLG